MSRKLFKFRTINLCYLHMSIYLLDVCFSIISGIIGPHTASPYKHWKYWYTIKNKHIYLILVINWYDDLRIFRGHSTFSYSKCIIHWMVIYFLFGISHKEPFKKTLIIHNISELKKYFTAQVSDPPCLWWINKICAKDI